MKTFNADLEITIHFKFSKITFRTFFFLDMNVLASHYAPKVRVDQEESI